MTITELLRLAWDRYVGAKWDAAWEAIELAERCDDPALVLLTKSYDVLLLKSFLLIKLMRYEEAVEVCDESMRLHPEGQAITYNRMIAIENLHQMGAISIESVVPNQIEGRSAAR